MKFTSNIALVALLCNLGLHAEASSLLRGRASTTSGGNAADTPKNKDQTKDVSDAGRKLQSLGTELVNSSPEDLEEYDNSGALEIEDEAEYYDYIEENPDLSMEEYNETMLDSNLEDEDVEPYYIEEEEYYDYFNNTIGEQEDMEDPSFVEAEESSKEEYYENAEMEDPMILMEEEQALLQRIEAEYFQSEDLDKKYESLNQVLYEEEDLSNEYLNQNAMSEEDQYELLMEDTEGLNEEAIGEVLYEEYEGEEEEEYIPYDAEMIEEEMEEAEELMEEAITKEEVYYDTLGAEEEYEMYDEEMGDGIILP